jgi:hypothetical protein
VGGEMIALILLFLHQRKTKHAHKCKAYKKATTKVRRWQPLSQYKREERHVDSRRQKKIEIKRGTACWPPPVSLLFLKGMGRWLPPLFLFLFRVW